MNEKVGIILWHVLIGVCRLCNPEIFSVWQAKEGVSEGSLGIHEARYRS